MCWYFNLQTKRKSLLATKTFVIAYIVIEQKFVSYFLQDSDSANCKDINRSRQHVNYFLGMDTFYRLYTKKRLLFFYIMRTKMPLFLLYQGQWNICLVIIAGYLFVKIQNHYLTEKSAKRNFNIKNDSIKLLTEKHK